MRSTLGVVFVNYRCGPAIADRAALRLAEGHHVVVVDNSGDYSGPGSTIDMGRNAGFGPACNAGAASLPANVRSICFHNPDLDIGAASLHELAERLDADPRSGAVVPALHTPNAVIENGYHEPQIAREIARAALAFRSGRQALQPVATPQADTSGIARRPPPTPGHRFGSGALLVARREAFTAVGGFDERYVLYGEDLDLWHRLRTEGFTMTFANDVVAEHAQGTGSPTSRSWREVLRFVGVQLFAELHQQRSWRAFRRIHRVSLTRTAGSPLHKLIKDSWNRDDAPLEVSAIVSEAFAQGIMDRDQPYVPQ